MNKLIQQLVDIWTLDYLEDDKRGYMRAVKCVLRELWPAMTGLLDDIALEHEMGEEES